MLLYEETKAFEKTIGPEATGLLAKVFERHDYTAREGLATKEDIAALRNDMTALRGEMKEDIASLRAELKEDTAAVRSEMKDMEIRLTIRLGTMMAASVALVAALVKLL